MKRLACLCLFLSISALTCRAGLTLLQRETFQGVGTLNAAAPGNLGAVTGNFYKRPVGPRLSGDHTVGSLGWSADAQNQASVAHTWPSGPAFPDSNYSSADPAFCCDWWVYVSQAPGSVTLFNLGSYVAGQYAPSGQTLLRVDLGSGSNPLAFQYSGYGIAGAVPAILPLNTWQNFRLVWKKTSGFFDFNVILQVRAAGSTTWTTLVSNTAVRMYGNLSPMQVGFATAGAIPIIRARYGMPSLYQLDSLADAALPVPDVVDPPAGPFHWYCNPATGNDTNDGTTPASAWASVAKINAESASLGLFPAAAFPVGDTLTIDTTGANLPLGATSLFLRTPGLNVAQLGSGEVQAWENVSGAGWTLTPGTGHVYQHALSGGATAANVDVVLWQNDLWLNHPTGNALADVQATLDATEGSFFVDGGIVYVHPFGSTNPASDGQVYTRSYLRGQYGDAAIMLCAPDLRLQNLRVRKTCMARKTDSDPYASYCYQTAEAAGGSTRLEGCYGDYGSKHIFGWTDNSLTRQYTLVNCQGEQATPYVGLGGQSVWVDFAGGSGTGSASSVYLNCVTHNNSGAIGSSAGMVNRLQPIWLSHGTGAVYSQMSFLNCNLAGGPLSIYEGVAATVIQGGSIPTGTFQSGNVVYDGVLIDGPPPTSLAANTTVTTENCLITPLGSQGDGQGIAGGNTVVKGCTIVNNVPAGALLQRQGTCNLTWENNLLLGNARAVLYGGTSADTLSFDHNAYSPADTTFFVGYNNGNSATNYTFAQWQALGKDTGSFLTANPLVNASYQPQNGSPLIDAGANLGTLDDYTGQVFPRRNDIGAFETFPGTYKQWQTTYFTAAQLGNASLSGDQGNPAGDGLVNLLKYAFDLDPNAAASAAARPTVKSGSGTVAITYTKALAATDLTYTVEQSTNLLQWMTATPTNTVLGTNGDAQQIQASVATGANPKLFLRLRVSRM